MATIKTRRSKKGTLSYQAIIRLKGFPTQTATFDKISEAKEWIKQTESSIKHGRYFKTLESKKHLLSELIDRYIEYELPNRKSDHKKFNVQLTWWKNKLASYYLSDITPAILSEYRYKLQTERKVSNATVNRYMAALSVVLSIAVRDWEWMEDNPLFKVRKKREARGRGRFLTEDERIKLLEACKKSSNPFLYYVVFLAIATGARASEIMNLTWDVIDFKRKKIYILETKNG